MPTSNNILIKKKYTSEEATSALAGFHVGPLSWSNWNLEMLLFIMEGKPENVEEEIC